MYLAEVLIKNSFFIIPFVEKRPPCLRMWLSEPREGLAVSKTKGSSLSIGSAPGIQPKTSRFAVKRPTIPRDMSRNAIAIL